MRCGIDDGPESRDHFFQILEGAFDRGVSGITVHGRTVRQRYNGPSNWDFLREVKRVAKDRTILGSGDLFSPAACREMLRQTGVDAVTVARGAIGNPWIFAQSKAVLRGEPLPAPPSLHEQRDVIRMHYELAGELYGPLRCCQLMRKFGIKYSRMHPQGTRVRDAFVQVRKPEDWLQVLAVHYADDLPGRHPPPTAEAAETPGAKGSITEDPACSSAN
jgi:tRNA-dihydrouridine synthase